MRRVLPALGIAALLYSTPATAQPCDWKVAATPEGIITTGTLGQYSTRRVERPYSLEFQAETEEVRNRFLDIGRDGLDEAEICKKRPALSCKTVEGNEGFYELGFLLLLKMADDRKEACTYWQPPLSQLSNPYKPFSLEEAHVGRKDQAGFERDAHRLARDAAQGNAPRLPALLPLWG